MFVYCIEMSKQIYFNVASVGRAKIMWLLLTSTIPRSQHPSSTMLRLKRVLKVSVSPSPEVGNTETFRFRFWKSPKGVRPVKMEILRFARFLHCSKIMLQSKWLLSCWFFFYAFWFLWLDVILGRRSDRWNKWTERQWDDSSRGHQSRPIESLESCPARKKADVIETVTMWLMHVNLYDDYTTIKVVNFVIVMDPN